MNGTIVSFIEKQRKSDGSVYLTVLMNEGAKQVQYFCSDEKTIAYVRDNVGNTFEYTTSKSKDGSSTWMSLPKGEVAKKPWTTGFTPKSARGNAGDRDNSFAASYAKDIAVACITAGLVKDYKEIKPIVVDYFDIFLGLMNQKEPSE